MKNTEVYEYLWRFDYTFEGLPYYVYVHSRTSLCSTTLMFLSRKLHARVYSRVAPLERNSVINRRIPVFTVRQLKEIFRQPGYRNLASNLFYTDSPY